MFDQSALIERFITTHTSDEPEILKKLQRETYLRLNKPHMMSGHVQGRLLSIISKLLQPKHILELGTFCGYGTYCLSEGLAPGGKIYSIEANPEIAHFAHNFFEQAGIISKVHLLQKSVFEALPHLEGITWDIVFIDADKEHYPHYMEAIWPNVRTGGLMLIDNVFWRGQAFNPPAVPDKQLVGILATLNNLKSMSDAEHTIIPLRDGLLMMVKNS
jgi:predicted O-methyltransferase YrrM